MSLRERTILGCLGIAVVVVALWFGVLAPKRNEATDLGARVTEAEQARADAVARAVSGEAAKASYGRDYATVARLGKAVPTQPDMPSLVYQLENAARAAKVDFRSMTVQSGVTAAAPGTPPATTAPGTPPATTAPGALAPTAFTFTIEGGYLRVRRMLAAIGGFSRVKGKLVSVSGRLLTLDTVKISPGREDLPQIKAEISAKSYVAQTPALPAAPAAVAALAATATPATSTPAAQVTP
jgi:Tfp pilus assembly protein PilO